MSAVTVTQSSGLQTLVALTPEQDTALALARQFEDQVARMKPFAPGSINLAVAAKNLRDYVAATL